MPEITGYPQGTPSWAELSTTDAAGALEFYSALLGWEDDPQSMGPDMGFYHMQRLRGLEAAALYEQGPEEKAQGIPAHWRTYFTVTNTDAAVERAKAAGGSVVFGPMDVFEAGRTCMLMDPQGAVFAVVATQPAYWVPHQGRARRCRVERVADQRRRGSGSVLRHGVRDRVGQGEYGYTHGIHRLEGRWQRRCRDHGPDTANGPAPAPLGNLLRRRRCGRVGQAGGAPWGHVGGWAHGHSRCGPHCGAPRPAGRWVGYFYRQLRRGRRHPKAAGRQWRPAAFLSTMRSVTMEKARRGGGYVYGEQGNRSEVVGRGRQS